MIMVLENIKTFFTKIITKTHLHLENNPYPAGHPSLIWRMSSDVIPSGDLKYIFRVAL